MPTKKHQHFDPYDEGGQAGQPSHGGRAPVDHNARTTRMERPTAPREERRDWRSLMPESGWRDRRHGRGGDEGGFAGRARVPVRIPDTSGFFMWVSQGGWRILAGIGGALVVLLVFLLLTGGDDEGSQNAGGSQQPTPPSGQVQGGAILTPSTGGGTDSGALPTMNVAPPTSASTVLFVSGTDVEGLFLRSEPGGTIIKTMPENTRVEVIGEDRNVDGRVWKHIREPGGLEGWSAADFLRPGQ